MLFQQNSYPNFKVHVGAAIYTNYIVIPWGGVAFSVMQFSREELLTAERFQTEQ